MAHVEVAHALLRAVSRLLDTVLAEKAVDMSVDAARRSARATSLSSDLREAVR